jgi:hypothetical protein
MKVKIFLQSEFLKDIEVLELGDNAGPNELHTACLKLLPTSEDIREFNLYVEDDDDEKSIKKLKKIPDGLCVHMHRLKGIDVQVRYAGCDVQRTFRPSATVGRVKKWSSHELGISASDAAELMLQISGTDTRPDTDIHIGALVKSPTCAICFDLVPSPRVNG